jgi:hypothetical protein
VRKALLGWNLGRQGIELFGWRLVRFPLLSNHRRFLAHMHELDASEDILLM